jgi:hydrogenase nickel incorporation protein HypA/HybF
MHEAAIASDLLEIVLQACEGQGVRRVRTALLELGVLSCVEPRSLEFAFEVLSRGTIAEGCALEVERPALVIHCPVCGHRGEADLELPGCPECGQTPVRAVQGREMRLVSIEVEDEDDAQDRSG